MRAPNRPLSPFKNKEARPSQPGWMSHANAKSRNSSATLPAESAGRSIDATGRIVMPGGIDPHVHLNRMRRRDTSGQSRTFFTAKWRISLVNPCVSADITGHRVIFADTLVCYPESLPGGAIHGKAGTDASRDRGLEAARSTL